MLSLKISDLKSLQFYNKIKSKIKKFAKLGLSSEDVKNLILNEPENLIFLNSFLMNKIIADFDDNEFIKYTNLPNKDKSTNLKYHSKIVEIKTVFNYKSIVGNDYFLADLLNQDTCLYCNRNYVITVGNSNKKINRAEYDHFFSQSKYPLLALSFYNLLPVCSNCNKKKNDTNFRLDSHLHPYSLNDEDKKFSFSYRKKNYIENNLKLNISTSNTISIKKISNTFKDLHLEEIYNSNSKKELRDLLDLRYKYSENYLDILLNKTFKSLSISKQEIYKMVFGIEINEDEFHKRPFSKFKKDIIEELLK